MLALYGLLPVVIAGAAVTGQVTVKSPPGQHSSARGNRRAAR